MILEICVKPNVYYQEIDGFGACGAFHQAALLKNYPEYLKNIALDLLFSNEIGIGLSIVRNIIGDSGDWGTETDGPTQSIEPIPGGETWYGDEDQIWFMREAQKRGCNQFISSAWSPPAWMKTNGSVSNGGTLKREMYLAYAKYLIRYVNGYKRNYGLQIFAISGANEPQLKTTYSSCLWSDDDLARFYKDFLECEILKDIPNLIIFGPETEHFGNRTLDEYRNAIQSRLPNIIAMHGYGGTIEPIDDSLSRKRKIWLSEISDTSPDSNDVSINDGLKWAEVIHKYLTIGEVSAFIFFWAISKYIDKGISLISLDLQKQDMIINKRLFALGHFSRFIKPGYHRVNISSYKSDEILLSAYRSCDHLVIVMINKSAENVYFAITGIDIKLIKKYRTSSSEELLFVGELPANNIYHLPGRSITTLSIILA